MARDTVTGKTEAELDALREEFDASPKADHYEFEEWYCLSKIPRQPEDYDGEKRFCVSTETKAHDLCKYHGGAGDSSNLDPLANMKHGMKATRENLIKDFSDADQELYDWIVSDWPDAYDINVEDDPLAEYEFHALAVEVVRAERAEGYVIGGGENGQKKVFAPDGSIHYEDVPHYLVDMLQRQRKLIMRMEDNLGISRKKRMANDQQADATDVLKSFAEVGAGLITGAADDGDGPEYDPDSWDPDDVN